jgi:hypothetical protein
MGILYPESSEYAKRSKYIAWRAAVEISTSAEQLALQVIGLRTFFLLNGDYLVFQCPSFLAFFLRMYFMSFWWHT